MNKPTPINILILEDQEDEASLYAKMATDGGFTCAYRTTSTAALNYARENAIDILILDVNLREEVSGIDLIPRFKEINPVIIIIIVTHMIEEELAVAAIQKGAYDFLLKPLHPVIFKHRLKCAAEKYQLMHQTDQPA